MDLADTFFLQKSISNNDQILAWTSSDFLTINLTTILAPVLSNHIIRVQTLITISGIHWQPYHHHPFNHIVKLIESTLPLLSQVLTIRERRRFESIPIQLEGYS